MKRRININIPVYIIVLIAILVGVSQFLLTYAITKNFEVMAICLQAVIFVGTTLLSIWNNKTLPDDIIKDSDEVNLKRKL